MSKRIQSYLQDEQSWSVLEEMESLAARHECSLSQIALAWLLQRRSITSPIIGPRTIAQLEDNLGSTEIQLKSEEIKKLEEISTKV